MVQRLYISARGSISIDSYEMDHATVEVSKAKVDGGFIFFYFPCPVGR